MLLYLSMLDTQEEKDKFTLVYEQYQQFCWYVAYQLLGDAHLAEDAVQETFLKVIRYFPQYQSRGKFRGFLYKVASNTCTDLWRKTGAVSLTEDMEFQETGYARSEAEVNFQYMVRSLSEELREVVYLKFAQELTLREISMVTQIPMRTVQSRLRRALKIMKKEMEGEV